MLVVEKVYFQTFQLGKQLERFLYIHTDAVYAQISGWQNLWVR